MKLKPILVIATVAAALAAGAAVLLAKRSVANTEKAKPTPVATVKPALTVTITRPSTADLPITLSANGNIVAWQEASVGAEANGLRLTEVHVNVGDEVKQGQVLAKFAAETIQADVAQARASLAEAVANAQESAANGDRAPPAADGRHQCAANQSISHGRASGHGSCASGARNAACAAITHATHASDRARQRRDFGAHGDRRRGSRHGN